MNDIVTQVRRVADLIAEIGAAAHEQGQGISQVGDAINQLDQTTQQNAALVEESAAAAHSLNSQAATLVKLVSVFRLAEDEAPRLMAQPQVAQVREVQSVAAQPAKPQRALAKPASTRPAAAKPADTRRAQAKPAPQSKSPLRVPGDHKPAQSNDDWESF